MELKGLTCDRLAIIKTPKMPQHGLHLPLLPASLQAQRAPRQHPPQAEPSGAYADHRYEGAVRQLSSGELSSGLTDKRTGLEIRVFGEGLEALGGRLKWISSERQYADSLTKEATRQLLADCLKLSPTMWRPRRRSQEEMNSPNLWTLCLRRPSSIRAPSKPVWKIWHRSTMKW